MSGAIGTSTTAPLPTTALPTDDTRPKPGEEPSSASQGFLGETWRGLTHSGMVIKDFATFAGVETDPDKGLGIKPVNVATITGVNALAAGMIAAKRGADLGLTRGQLVTESFNQMGVNGIRVTPTLVSAIAGPAVADGVTYLVPNLLPKYKKEMSAKDKNIVQAGRAIAGGIAVGVAAGVVFLLKPDLFKKAGFISEAARSGMITNGAGEVVRQIAPMAKDAVFSHRMILGLAGGLGTLLLANKAVGEKDDQKKLMWGVAAAATGALTVGGIALMPRLTRGAAEASKIAFLPGGESSAMFWKPNVQWLKEFGGKIAPITAIPAGTAASQYFDIVSDFETITSPRSPFNK